MSEELNKESLVVMIVDDDASTRMMATEFLTQAGFTVAEAADGVEALARAAQVRPDMVILDVEMPNLNGFETCVQLREMPAFGSTPILMLTGLDNSQSIDLAYEAGATDFATKPINWSLLCYRVRYMLRASQASELLFKNQASLAAAQRIARLGNWEYDVAQKRLVWSEQLFHILGLRSTEIKPSHEAFLARVHEGDRSRVAEWMSQDSASMEITSIDHRILLSDGDVRSVRQQIERTFDSEGTLVLLQAIVQDFTEQRRAEEKIHQLAYYDSLTNLPNRVLLQEHLENDLAFAKRYNTTLAVLFLDLDDFKRVNDTLGHAVGDLLLQEVGKRLRKNLRCGGAGAKSNTINVNAMVSRMGGDEFIILLSSIEDVSDAISVANRILNVLTQPYNILGNNLYTSPSIGISMYPTDGLTAQDLLRNADMAMYSAKRSGKNIYKLHSVAMDDAAQHRYKIDVCLRSALENEEFEIFYQPQLDLSTGVIFSVEALIRWRSKELGFVMPSDFIPVAEENGLIVPMGQWVLRTACEQAQKWIEEGFLVNKVAVNISVLQFMRPDFPAVIEDILFKTGLPAKHLELEITESLLANDIFGAVDTLRELKNIGVELSIDDFGTGYSSLSQLKNFPIDRLKIDQSFISNVTTSKEDAAITEAVIAMSDSMKIKVLAEGVETPEQLEFLRQHGCNEIQGYLIGKPQPASEIEANMPSIDDLLGELISISPVSNLKTGT